jgi:hypothetical protein
LVEAAKGNGAISPPIGMSAGAISDVFGMSLTVSAR